MIGYLPAIYEDELVYSWFCRYYVHMGYPTHKMALDDIYSKRSDNPSKEFIGHINPTMREAIQQQYSLTDLVLHHTMYPQYARFLPPDRKRFALSTLAEGHEDAHHLFQIPNRDCGDRYMRYCPLCAAEDRERYGEAYWHRKHQLRRVSVCTKHQCYLKESTVSAKSEQFYVFFPAENFVGNDSPVFCRNDSDLAFSRYVVEVFERPVNLQEAIPIGTVLYDGMSRTKYLKPSGRTRYTTQFSEYVKQMYEEMGFNDYPTFYQIQRIIHGKHFDFTGICQIAFAINLTTTALTNPMIDEAQIELAKQAHVAIEPPPEGWKQYDRKMAPILQKLCRDIYSGKANENGRPERVSLKRVYRELDLPAHRLDNMPRCRALLKKYDETYEESWARRIVWAYRKLETKSERPVFWSDIRRISGVKKKNMEKVLPYLPLHTDGDEAEKIKSLLI